MAAGAPRRHDSAIVLNDQRTHAAVAAGRDVGDDDASATEGCIRDAARQVSDQSESKVRRLVQALHEREAPEENFAVGLESDGRSPTINTRACQRDPTYSEGCIERAICLVAYESEFIVVHDIGGSTGGQDLAVRLNRHRRRADLTTIRAHTCN